MNDYIDVIPPIVAFLNPLLPFPVYGNRFPLATSYPAVMVRSAGGVDTTRLQLIARAESDIDAMSTCILAMNTLERWAEQDIRSLAILSCERETQPILMEKSSTEKTEAWVYMKLLHLEA